jgi:lipid-A-disaccharide synthase
VTKVKSYFVSAGEYSGDLIGADAVCEISALLPSYQAFGLAGPAMRRAGVQALAHSEDFSVMGIWDVAVKLTDLRLLEQKILAHIDREAPSFALLIDYPGLHFRLAEQLTMRGIPVFQYVAPKVWAWGSGRLEQLRKNFTQVFGILPFEESFFLREGVPYQYVGCPVRDRVDHIRVNASDVLGYAWKQDQPIVAFLPGSRISEIKHIWPSMVRIREHLRKQCPDTLCVVPVAQSLNWNDVVRDEDVIYRSPNLLQTVDFTFIRGASLELMSIADAAVVASGTATLECGLAECPMVVVYVMPDVSYEIAKHAVKVQWASLVNLALNRPCVTEYIQHFSPQAVASEVASLVDPDSPARMRMLSDFAELREMVQGGAAKNLANILSKFESKREV